VPNDAAFPEGGESYICQFTFASNPSTLGRLIFQGRIVTRGDLTA